ncbi:15397_t:CDS:2, partial [Acaulospora colombiana]
NLIVRTYIGGVWDGIRIKPSCNTLMLEYMKRDLWAAGLVSMLAFLHIRPARKFDVRLPVPLLARLAWVFNPAGD